MGFSAMSWDDGLGQMLQALQQQNSQQQQLLQAMRRGGIASAGPPAARRSGGAGGGRQFGGGQAREGDWECRRCKFSPNFASRRRCFQCGEARPGAAASRGGSISAGPVGAGGLRPQLAWGSSRLGSVDQAPTHRIPGSSAAAASRPHGTPARANATSAPAQPGRKADVAGQPMAAAARGPKPTYAEAAGASAGIANVEASGHAARANVAKDPAFSRDDEGYQEVVNRAARRRRAKQGDGGWNEGPGDAMEVEDTCDEAGDWQQAEDEHSDIGDGGWDQEWNVGDPEGDCGHELEEDDPTVLKQRLDKEQATVRALVREGLSEGHPAMVAAVAARDGAEAAWKSSKAPHPVARRMGWAQRRLDKALRSQDRVRDELAEFDAQAEEQRGRILERLSLAKDRVAKHRQALEELQDEAATAAPSTRSAAEVCAKLAGGMRSSIAPEVEALAARIPEGSGAQLQLNLLVAQLQNLQGELEQLAKTGTSGPVAYDIADDDGVSEAEWSESHDLQGTGGGKATTGRRSQQGSTNTPRWQPKGHGRWNKNGGGAAGDAGKGQGATVGSAEGGQPNAPTAGGSQVAPTDARTQAGATGAAPSGEQPTAEKGGMAHGGSMEDGAPSSKFRRGQAPSDSADAFASVQNTSRALEAMQNQSAIAAAGAHGTNAAIQAAAQVHTRNVAMVVSAALAQGVQPLTAAGEELIMLGPQELSVWAATHLKKEEVDGAWW